MASRSRRVVAALACVTVVAAVALVRLTDSTAAPRETLAPFAHWVFDATGVKGGKVADRAGKLDGTLTGKPTPITEPTAALEFADPRAYVIVNKAVTPKDGLLPKQDFTVASWVRIDEPTEWGGILGCFQDNGPKEKGFIVGYNKTGFYFGLATTGADDGDGKVTYLNGKSKYEVGRWYHVAATYDGKTMRLFVNGVEDATSTAQSGPVLYADSAPLVIGRYQDTDEDYPFQGAIREVLWCDKAVPADKLLAHFQADEALAKLAPKPAALRFEVSPYLQFATRTGITIMSETTEDTDCEVKYGTTYPPKEVAKSAKAGTMHEIPLTNLQPNTKYFYQVTCATADGKTVTSKPLTFATAVGPTDAYSFCVIGDTQRNPAATSRVAKIMWERRPNFVIHVGDVVNDGEQKWQWTGDLFKSCEELLARVPIYPCLGNHEKNHPNYYKYFSLPKPEYYYSYTYGNAEFFVLDTNKSVAVDTEQYKWLAAALAKSTAKWKVCYHHHPCYSSDSDDYGNTWKGNTTFGALKHKGLIPLYEKHNVDMVLNGHIHLYERTHPIRGGKVDPKGVVHVTSGGGGGNLEDFDPVPAFFKKQGRVTFHCCYFTVHGGQLECRVFDDEGRLFDQWELKKE